MFFGALRENAERFGRAHYDHKALQFTAGIRRCAGERLNDQGHSVLGVLGDILYFISLPIFLYAVEDTLRKQGKFLVERQ